MDERECCIRKDYTSIRNKERISVICNLMKELWIAHRSSNPMVGFYFLTNYIEGFANKDGADTFYWEEDKWYDTIQEMIKNAKKMKQEYIIPEDELQEMSLIIMYFENYWNMYQDLRLKQLLNLFNNLMEEKIRSYLLFGVQDWKFILVGEQLHTLQNKIESLKNFKEDIDNGTIKDSYINSQQIIREIENVEKQYQKIKKEFDL